VRGRRVRKVEAFPIDIELLEPFAIASGAPDRAHNVVVRVELEDGTGGIGEAAPFEAVTGETQASTLAAVEALASAVGGADAGRWRAVAAAMFEARPDQPAARAAIEQALLDALGKAAALPLWCLFGGTSDALTTDVTIPAGDVDHARRSAERYASRGFSTLKIKVGARAPSEDADRVEAVSRAAPGARLLLDANGGYAPDEALALLAELGGRRVEVGLFEQPVAAGDLDGMARLAAEGGVPICADESARSARDVVLLARAGAAHAVNIKIMKSGVAEAIAMRFAAEAAGLGLMIGGMVEAELAMTFSAHLATGLGGFDEVDLDTPLFMRTSPFEGGFSLQGARIVLPEAPGIGVRLK
jgi:L-alanine-DL-glutamate epimerase-like enolase superfamily enzyme